VIRLVKRKKEGLSGSHGVTAVGLGGDVITTGWI
jgi:hypothetical protein